MIERTHQQIGLTSGVILSDCKQYRYRLWREWDASKPAVCFIMLNLYIPYSAKPFPMLI